MFLSGFNLKVYVSARPFLFCDSGARISSSYLCAGRRGVLQDSRASIAARKNFGSGRFKAFSAIRREGTSSDWCTEYSLFY